MGSKVFKRKGDANFGHDRRDDAINFLNSILIKHNVDGQFRRALPTEGRGKKFNDFIFHPKDDRIKMPFMFVYAKSTGFYIKAASKLRDYEAAKRYLLMLKEKHFGVILVDDSNVKFSGVLTINTIMIWWKYKPYYDIIDNENRIQFYGHWSNMYLVDPEYTGDDTLMPEPALWEQLKHLLG